MRYNGQLLYEGTEWIHVALVGGQWRTVVDVNLSVP